MNLNVNDDAMQALVSKAIVDSLTPETREKLIASAVKSALSASSDRSAYGDKRSALQRAFDEAVYSQASKIAEEWLQSDPEFQSNLKGLFSDVANKLFEESSRDALASSLASTIRAALTKDRY